MVSSIKYNDIINKNDVAATSVDSAQSSASASMRDQQLWSLIECRDTFDYCISALKERLRAARIRQQKDTGSDEKPPVLTWDKASKMRAQLQLVINVLQDDDVAVDFVTAVANVRAHIFGITQKSRFDVKCRRCGSLLV